MRSLIDLLYNTGECHRLPVNSESAQTGGEDTKRMVRTPLAGLGFPALKVLADALLVGRKNDLQYHFAPGRA